MAPAGPAATAAAVAAASAEAVAAASVVGAASTVGVDGPLAAGAVLAVAVVSLGAAVAPVFVPLSPDVPCWAVVAALAFAAAFALAAAMAWAAAAVCLTPCAITTVAITLPFMPALVATLLLEAGLVLPLPFAVGLELAVFCAPEAWLGPDSVVLAVVPRAGDGCCGCCAAWEAGVDWAGVAPGGSGVGGFAGIGDDGAGDAAAAASSKAANGCEAISWLDEDACIDDGGMSETAAGKSGAILDILDTWEPLERHGPDSVPPVGLQPAGQRSDIVKTM